MARRRKKGLRRRLLGSTPTGRLVRAAGLAGLLSGSGYLASRSRGGNSSSPSSVPSSASSPPRYNQSSKPSGSVKLTPVSKPSTVSPSVSVAPKKPVVKMGKRRNPSVKIKAQNIVGSKANQSRTTQRSMERIRVRTKAKADKLASKLMGKGRIKGVSNSQRDFLSNRLERLDNAAIIAGRSPRSKKTIGGKRIPSSSKPRSTSLPKNALTAGKTQKRLTSRVARGVSRSTIGSIDKENSGRWGLIARANKPIKSRKDATEIPTYKARLEANRLKRKAAEQRLKSLPPSKPRGRRV